MQIVRNGFQIIIIEIILIYTQLKCQNGRHRAMFWDQEQKKNEFGRQEKTYNNY